MRSIEYLIQLFPDKTGAELLKIQADDKAEDVKAFEKANESKLLLIKDINQNGGYYKGRFGSDQRFFYRFYDLTLENNIIYCSVETIVVFLGEKNGVVRDNEIRIEKRIENYKVLENYGISMYTRINNIEFDSLVNYLNAVSKFWN